jgi:Outer membrane receptor for ferric coprogen and ferric-rhodotorulic acid
MQSRAALSLRFIIVVLTLFCASAALFACNTSAGENTNTPTVAIVADGSSDYVIVRPDITSQTVTDAAVKLKNAILDATGVELSITTDWVARGETAVPATHEILVGQTNRTQSQSALSPLSGNSYYAGLSGDYLVLTGTTDEMVAAAVDAFIGENITGKTELKIPTDYTVTLSLPEAISPADGAVGVSLTPTFEFMPGSGNGCTVEVLASDGQDWSVAYSTAVSGGATTCTLDTALNSCTTYKWRVKSGDLTADGGIFTTQYDYASHPANTGISYTFDGSMSEEVLDNYLSRAINHFYFESTDPALLEENKRFILNTGAKFIGRASTMWGMYSSDESVIDEYAKAIADVHNSDPDIIFEACIFETTFTSINDIPIPAWVFEAFGQKPETRNFSYDAMLFPEGDYLDMWGEGGSVPDMRQTETQMWFYYRAALFIDAGFESIHMGQVHLIGARDTDFACWTKVCNMIREYASTHARRHFVLLNAHTHGITGTDGLLLFDFHRYPSRCKVPDSQTNHAPSAEDPQKVIFSRGYEDSLYGRSLGGTTHSGWKCDNLLYLVELDNYVGYYPDKVDKSTADWWGFDEISWFVNQPYSYQREYLAYAYKWVSETDSGVGHFEMPGTRTAAIRTGDDLSVITQTNFHPFDKIFYSGGTDVENIIREVWVADNK